MAERGCSAIKIALVLRRTIAAVRRKAPREYTSLDTRLGRFRSRSHLSAGGAINASEFQPYRRTAQRDAGAPSVSGGPAFF